MKYGLGYLAFVPSFLVSLQSLQVYVLLNLFSLYLLILYELCSLLNPKGPSGKRVQYNIINIREYYSFLFGYILSISDSIHTERNRFNLYGYILKNMYGISIHIISYRYKTLSLISFE